MEEEGMGWVTGYWRGVVRTGEYGGTEVRFSLVDIGEVWEVGHGREKGMKKRHR